ncbi:MAG TPA: TetR family transcriptional regulator C-terminal domain-containing protein [Gemmatimonadales bacterium]|nr:TetR family transcriptional regulator C-terminal domain-containing protein [Gemmatimonadales bacterium]
MPRRTARTRVRAPDQTRETLLQAAFLEMFRHGFQAASLERILGHTGVTKGALYHHFPDKAALGLAVVNEVVRGLMLARWVAPLEVPGDALPAFTAMLRDRASRLTPREIELGCPLNNLAQEMAPLDARFRRAIDAIYAEWRAGVARALVRGQAEGSIRRDIDAAGVAAFLVAAVEGSYGLAKGTGDGSLLRNNLRMLELFLEGLRPGRRARR